MIRTADDNNIHEGQFSGKTELKAATISGGDVRVVYEHDPDRLVVSEPDTNAY